MGKPQETIQKPVRAGYFISHRPWIQVGELTPEAILEILRILAALLPNQRLAQKRLDELRRMLCCFLAELFPVLLWDFKPCQEHVLHSTHRTSTGNITELSDEDAQELNKIIREAQLLNTLNVLLQLF